MKTKSRQRKTVDNRQLKKLQKIILISLAFSFTISFSALAQKDTTCDSKKLVGTWILIRFHGGNASTKDLEMTTRLDSLKKNITLKVKNSRDSLIFNTDNTCNVNEQKNYVIDSEKCTLKIPGNNDATYIYHVTRKDDLLTLTNCTFDCITEVYLKIK